MIFFRVILPFSGALLVLSCLRFRAAVLCAYCTSRVVLCRRAAHALYLTRVRGCVRRSLVALSLILSMLLFKPAPLYILDEVDAALDLSHTQNIGQMLRTHFKHSQFIVVSLKDGMFNNANVLFKTKFVDGVSTVTRYAQNQPIRDASSVRPAGKKQPASKDDKAKRQRTEASHTPLGPTQGWTRRLLHLYPLYILLHRNSL